ncbi:Jacalin-like lectin domain [Arabidopsis thaliana x Arabidopsis arenosa]|uniref:Jacalin-like lectin domain n=1 Tax=Arabidopsis thaliana x Arabidopsis arenosa TaxID=1240361 RepID=A0A8T2CAZ6_9BRAS|nr:Jacalin-like lectin domain [Arabidopsis thaliana x Arabidopsis arenosa]
MSQDSNAFEIIQPEGPKWDDGFDHDDVTKIYLIGGKDGIQFIKIDYIKSGEPKNGSFHGYTGGGFKQMFEIDNLKNEYLESVEGYFCSLSGGFITAIQFKTNLRVSELMGYTNNIGRKLILANHGKKIIGFKGFILRTLDDLDAYFTPITPTRMEAQGGKGGVEWDDGADHDSVTKIQVRINKEGIQYIKFNYVDKDGHPEEQVHGSDTGKGNKLEPFEINHIDKEYLLSIDGYYNEESGVIQTLQFKTNIKTSEVMGNDEEGTKFTLGCNGHEIIGFHGYAKDNLNSLGVYITTLPLTKLEYKGSGGEIWDDGTFQGVKKVSIYSCRDSIRCIEFEYVNDGKMETRVHGTKIEVEVTKNEFVLDYPNEFLTSVEGTYDTYITSLTFKTSKNRTSLRLGKASDSSFLLESKGCALVGFHGASTYGYLYTLGAYSFPMTPLAEAGKLCTQAGDRGASQDHGGFGGV